MLMSDGLIPYMWPMILHGPHLSGIGLLPLRDCHMSSCFLKALILLPPFPHIALPRALTLHFSPSGVTQAGRGCTVSAV